MKDHGPQVNTWANTLRKQFEPLFFKNALVPEKLHPLHEKFEPDISIQRKYVKGVHMTINFPDDDDSDGEYTLNITSEGNQTYIKCTASSFSGGYYAVQTLRQLFYKHSEISEAILYTPYAPLHIKDKPVFKHRGLNLDIARNRIEPDAVLRTIDGMASSKLNRHHIHATDSQSWPLEVPSLPELAREGAYHSSQVWTCDDLERVQKYGRDRAVEVFLEIKLITGYDLRPWDPWDPWALKPPSGQLKLNNGQAIDFLKTLLSDVLPRCAKYSSFFHIGADEINSKVYELDPGVGSSDPDAIRPGLQALADFVIPEIINAGLTPIAFEELLLDWEIELPKSVIIQVWRSHESLARVAKKGHRAIFGPSSHWYLDGGHGGWLDPDPNSADSPVKSPFLDWCSPYKNWKQVCSYNSFESVPDELREILYGGETSLGCELTDSVNLDNKLWPRAAAAAETLWAWPGKIDEQMTRRLAEFRERLVLQGFGAAMVQMEWSLRNLGGSLL